MYVDIVFFLIEAIPIVSERVTKHYETFWVGYNATRYCNFNTLPYAFPYALPYIFSQFNIERP